MNQWDIDRANCDVPDDSDEEQEKNTNISSQLISGNTKGPSALSYRRIIFGTDGKVRPVYSEKNRNGYGIFSYVFILLYYFSSFLFLFVMSLSLSLLSIYYYLSAFLDTT
jgi:hypothetical protein